MAHFNKVSGKDIWKALTIQKNRVDVFITITSIFSVLSIFMLPSSTTTIP